MRLPWFRTVIPSPAVSFCNAFAVASQCSRHIFARHLPVREIALKRTAGRAPVWALFLQSLSHSSATFLPRLRTVFAVQFRISFAMWSQFSHPAFAEHLPLETSLGSSSGARCMQRPILGETVQQFCWATVIALQLLCLKNLKLPNGG